MVTTKINKPCPLCDSYDTKNKTYWTGTQYKLSVKCLNPMCIGNRLEVPSN